MPRSFIKIWLLPVEATLLGSMADVVLRNKLALIDVHRCVFVGLLLAAPQIAIDGIEGDDPGGETGQSRDKTFAV